ncbi:hypothetical protein B5P46_02210 [Rhizobium leguminosarum]|uniref:Uncharacterized protein n=2 Tax=Rhizobium leguminosarum TaxID=384 RepID=A0A4Q1UD27_RHILE|nr:hypothetical protein B5P46_02210 [Rhizobium leguminosarum]
MTRAALMAVHVGLGSAWKGKGATRRIIGNIVRVLWFGALRERQMNLESDRRALAIYIGAIILVGLLIVLGATLSWNAGGKSDAPAQISTETNP